MVERDRSIVGGRSHSAAQWLIMSALVVIAVVLAGELAFTPPPAAAQTGLAGEEAKVFAVAGRVTRDTYGLYLVDLKNNTICVYEFIGGGRPSLRLMAARTFIYDRQLDEYNTMPPVKEIKELVEEARRIKDVTTRRAP